MEYNIDYSSSAQTAAISPAYIVISILIAVITIVALWKIFTKAGQPGWAAIIPFYDLYILYKITWGNGWYFLLTLIPCANIVIYIITLVKLAKVFGKGAGFACGLIFLEPIFLCILAFGDAQYQGIAQNN